MKENKSENNVFHLPTCFRLNYKFTAANEMNQFDTPQND